MDVSTLNYAYVMCARNVTRGTEFKVIETLIDTFWYRFLKELFLWSFRWFWRNIVNIKGFQIGGFHRGSEKHDDFLHSIWRHNNMWPQIMDVLFIRDSNLEAHFLMTFVSPWTVIQDSLGFQILRRGFCIPGTGLRIPYQWNLDSGFQPLAGFRIPLAELRIPKPSILRL